MSPITTHILDISSGTPAAGVTVILSIYGEGEKWDIVARGTTNEDGRIPDLLPDGAIMKTGVYRLHFATGDYFQSKDITCFHPFIEVLFEVKDLRHHHVPLLLSPFGYSTYRGS